jgi:hypothetical protein
MLGPMRHRLWLLGAAALLAGCVSSVATSGSAGRPGNSVGAVCGPQSARTLARDAVARVYTSAGNVYGCAARTKRSYRLGTTGASIAAARVEAIRVAGRTAAYGVRTSGVDTGHTTVNVRRLTTGALLAQRSATTTIGVEGSQSIDSLVLKADGAVAWIATAHSIGPPTFVREVQKLDGRGFAVLDSGPDVAAASLTLRGSALSWKHRTTLRTATLR